ncbi:MAG: LacI family DNA-binding transcriptional regulator [Saprospiraceae bacterium]
MNREKKEITIYDIAAQLKVSTATVSRALRDDPAVSSKTKKKILDFAEQHGYQTNQFARNLRQRQTQTIGVIIPRLNSYFMATVIAGVEQVANAAGYNLLISQSSESVERERSVVRTMFNNRVDGLLVSLSYNTDSLDHFSKFAEKNVPVIFFDRTFKTNNFTSISINNFQAGYEATRHLIEIGCTRIAHVTVSIKQSIYKERFLGYAQALAEANIPLDMALISLGDLSLEAGATAVDYLLTLAARPDGIFVANDTCAAGCVIHLKKQGIRIPDDIAVVGFNNDPICRIVEPNLTSISYPGHEMGELAVRSLINHLNGDANIMLTQHIQLRSDLIVRHSTKIERRKGKIK